ncbi:MAG: hypothetical protein J2P35_23570, partial [Actinobacteria bacterium]|nr:hypothetical protein [Actinomycetota bacterium]
TRVTRRPERARPPMALTKAAVVALSALALLAAACGGSPPATGSGNSAHGGGSAPSRSASSQLLAFAQCMRSHGLPSFPDPASDDKLPNAHRLGVSESRYQAAMNACRHLLPNGGSGPGQSALQQQLTAMLPFSRCMRAHGISDWPDPTIYTNPAGITAVVFNVIGRNGLDRGGVNSLQVQTMERQCHHLLPSGFRHFRFVSN